MYLIVTRSFPPELGGMQSLIWGLSKELSKNFMISLGVSGYVSKQRSSGSQENKMKKHINNTLLKFI